MIRIVTAIAPGERRIAYYQARIVCERADGQAQYAAYPRRQLRQSLHHLRSGGADEEKPFRFWVANSRISCHETRSMRRPDAMGKLVLLFRGDTAQISESMARDMLGRVRQILQQAH